MVAMLINQDVRDVPEEMLRGLQGCYALLYDKSFLVGIFPTEESAIAFGEASIAPKEFKVRLITYEKESA